jgi:hypothetical protein
MKAKKLVGIWMDHEKAILVALEGGTETVEKIQSGVEGHFRLSGGSRTSTPYGPQAIVSDKKPDERRRHQFHAYYARLVVGLRGADSIYIFGPGDAPNELAKEIAKSKRLAPRVAAVERADKMTDRQVAARVKEFFHASEERGI